MKIRFAAAWAAILTLVLSLLVGGCQTSQEPSRDVETSQPAPSPAPSTEPPQQTDQKTPTSEGTQPDMKKVTAVRLADFSTGWVGGEGWIARTEDAGQNWQVQQQVEGIVSQLFALNSQDAWAAVSADETAAKERLLFHTTNGGKQWGVTGKVPGNGFFHFVSKEEAFSGNWQTTDGGKTWKELPIPKQVIGETYFHDRLNGWAVTQEKNATQVMRTVDGGKTWKVVMSREAVEPPVNAVIRSAGPEDAWVEWIGGSGMTQTSYSLFHTTNGGGDWQVVIAKASAGGGPAPGFPADYHEGPSLGGSSPGPFYVVDPKVAFLSEQCMACDVPNIVGWTKDGGKTLGKSDQKFSGYGPMLLAFADAQKGWLITTDATEPSVMYTTTDGGKRWTKVPEFH